MVRTNIMSVMTIDTLGVGHACFSSNIINCVPHRVFACGDNARARHVCADRQVAKNDLLACIQCGSRPDYKQQENLYNYK